MVERGLMNILMELVKIGKKELFMSSKNTLNLN